MSDVYDLNKNPFGKGGNKAIVIVAAVVVVLMILSTAFVTIGPGQKGVVFSRISGIKDLTLSEGLHFKIPYFEVIIPIDVRIQKVETDAIAASKDLQTVTSRVAVNYHLDPDKVNVIYQTIGLDFRRRIIDPAIHESVKAATAQFTAESLVSKREQVKEIIKENLRKRLATSNIIVDEFSIIDFSFSKEFDRAIEAKQTAEQNALRQEWERKRIEIEADQKLISARAEAEAQRIQAKTISAKIVQLRAIEKWDGKLPTVTGGATPFIDINKLKAK